MTALSSFLIEQVRQIPLDSILSHFGLQPHREGTTTRYKNDEINIVVGGNGLWFDNAASVGGRGAIDLALHLKGRVHPRSASPHDLQIAIQWLSDLQPGLAAVTTAASPTPQAITPRESFESQKARLAIRDDARWPLARNYLLHTRRLPGELVDSLYQLGHLYASFSEGRPAQTCVCFVHRNLDGEARGATLRNTTDGPGFPLSIGEKQGAWFTLGDPATASRAVLVEAPIDAISYAALKQPDDAVILSMSCSHAPRPVLEAAHARLWPLSVAFDNDRAGHAGWEHCRENYTLLYPNDPPPRRIVPAGKDWNDDLRTAPRATHRRGL